MKKLQLIKYSYLYYALIDDGPPTDTQKKDTDGKKATNFSLPWNFLILLLIRNNNSKDVHPEVDRILISGTNKELVQAKNPNKVP